MFRLEKEMTPVVTKWLKDQGLLVKPEFTTPWGICDLVGCSLNPESVVTRRGLKQSAQLSDPLRAAIFNAMPDESAADGITLDAICFRFGGALLRRTIERNIDQLERERFVFRTDCGTFKSRNSWKPLHQRILSIELKLSQIRGVVDQAMSNRCFSSESYIALPADVSGKIRSSVREYCVEQGIGILSVSTASCEVIVQSRQMQVDEALQLHLVDRFWRDVKRDKAA